MPLDLLHNDVQDFINTHLKSNLSKLILKGSPFEKVSIQQIAEQITSKNKSEKKLPTWFETEDIVYPLKVSIEQSSSEIAAQYKADLISGDTLIDLTGGFGVDAYYFSKKIERVLHCELNEALSGVVTHNYQKLNAKNIKCLATDGIAFLKTNPSKYDWIYADPSRRNESKGKVFLLEDCLPNVPKHLDSLFEKSDNILLKLSPVLDLTDTIRKLQFIKAIHIIAIKNEVKELLFILKKDYSGVLEIKTVNFSTTEVQKFSFQQDEAPLCTYSLPKTYIYEPNSAILKSGGFQIVSDQLKLHKLHKHSHLYTSDKLIEFPGRVFQLKEILPYNKKQLKRYFTHKKANITTRNFPETVKQIRKKTGIQEGGAHYLFFTTNTENKFITLICDKI
jgi:hypothetical protein